MNRVLDAGESCVPILGMQPLFPKFQPAMGFLRIVAEQFPKVLVPPDLVLFDVPIPNDVVGGAGDNLEAFFAFEEFFLRPPGGPVRRWLL